ncbi:RE1 [Symbiodinium sp. KB8]|nr:RE1 [Symbiodinium sp. KB8]
MVQETVWSPGGDDSAGSYSKEQLEAEVKRQVTARGEAETQASAQRSGNVELMRREAIHLDFPGTGMSKGVSQRTFVAKTYQEAILVDYQDVRAQEKVSFLLALGYLKAIHPDFLDTVVRVQRAFKGVEVSDLEVLVITFLEAIHLDFQETVMDLSGGMIEKIIFLEAIHPDFRDTDVSKGVVLFFSMHREYQGQNSPNFRKLTNRLDKRAASMLLQAVPEALKNELMANRLSTTLGILGRILVIYRPGSAAERQHVLRALETPGNPTTASDLVDVLRRWMRWLKRAQDLGLQVPDASILLKGLDSAARQQLEKHPEVVFRSNMMRFSLDLDSAPSLGNVMRYHGHLLAEFEQLSFRTRGKASGAALPTVKNVAVTQEGAASGTPKAGTSPSSTATTRPCKFYLSDTGCQRSACKFVHDWQSVPREDRANKCKGCGGKGHMKKDCPMKSGGDAQGRGDGGKGAANPKVKNVRPDKREDGTLPASENSSSTTSAPAATMGEATTTPASSTTTAAPTTTSSSEDFLRNATQILKMMAEQSTATSTTSMPSMKMLKTAVHELEARMALVDSGATHPLRKAQLPEWEQAPEVDVVVAGDGVARMRQSETGTLLTSPSAAGSQTILPVGNLVKILGYELIWSRRKCILRAPDGREIPLRISSGCPEVNEATALDLIARIEEEKLGQLREKAEITKLAMMRAQQVAQVEQWETSMQEYVTSGKFEDGFRAVVSMPWLRNVPREELIKVVMDIPKCEEEAWELMKCMGFNRRMRKRLVHKDWVIKFYSGARSQIDKLFRPVDANNTITLDIDELRNSQWDMLKEGRGIYELLLWGAATGRVAGMMASLPKDHAEQHLSRLMMIAEVAKQGRKMMCQNVDLPEDGVAVVLWASSEAEEDQSAQAFQREWFKRWYIENRLGNIYFEQGGLGHPLRRPTTMVTNMDISELRGMRDERSEEATWGQWSTWAPMMVHVLVRGWKRWKQRPGWYSRMVKALKVVDRKAWERHLANDHVPHRPDCLQCIHNSTGRPHRRCLHKDCYVMSADTLGPVRVAGPKGEKYALVFTYQFPKQKMSTEDEPVREEDLVGWDLDVKPRAAEENVVEAPEEEENVVFDEDLGEYEPSEQEELSQEEQPELQDSGSLVGLRGARKKHPEAAEDWWEFREAAGVLIRHHEVPRQALFRPSGASGCPVHPGKLDDTRITDIKYTGGGVETETSDWHGPKSGARSLGKSWTRTTRFKVSMAEVPEDEAVLQRDEEQWEKLIGDLTKPVEMETIYMVYPVRSKRGGDAMLAIQEAVLRLKVLGLPVARLHTDRGSEFASRGLHRWLLDHDIYHTRSEALVPQTNGAAERGVRWFKTRAKVLLAEAGIPLKYWTLAMQHAANRRLHDRLGLTKPMLLRFGSKVMIRRKIFGNNKKYDLTDRWEEGKYLGLSDTIKGGAVVLRATGAITETLNLREGVVDPKVLLAAEEDDGGGVFGEGEVPIIDLPEADHRLRDKEQPPPLPEVRKVAAEGGEVKEKKVVSGWKMRALVQQQEMKAKMFYEMGKFDNPACAEVLGEIELSGTMKNKARGVHTTSMILGAYVHGGMRGMTKAGRRRPQLTKFLNMVLRKRVAEDLGEDGSWTTIGVFKAADIPPHRDQRNQVGSWNYVIEIGAGTKGGLWVANEKGDSSVRGGQDQQPMAREQPDGKMVEGTIVNIEGKAAAFNAKELHAYLDSEPERWIIAAFTPLGATSLSTSTVAQLTLCGFPLDGSGVQRVHLSDEDIEMEATSSSDEEEEDVLEKKVCVLRCTLEQETLQEEKFKHLVEDRLEWGQARLHERDCKVLRQVAKVSPGEAGDYEVETILENLSGPLEVVHNVSLHEARRYIDRWRGAVMKEVEALVNSGTVRRLTPEQAREMKAKGMVFLPGKAVFTAKPPSDQNNESEKFRRKCRIVVCGNYLPCDKANVYASGTSADGLRVSVSYAVVKRWRAAATDISNAFTLAPMPEDKLFGMSPPSVVVAAGGAATGESWAIERVLYGLREAPRWWGVFRNGRLCRARIAFEEEFIVFECLETEENVWRILFEGCDEVKGILLIYVDDLLMLSTAQIIKAVYQWLTEEWKCSPLQWMDEEHLRFLGVELRPMGSGIHVSQSGYIRDLLRQHGVQENPGSLTVPCTREWLQDPDSEDDEDQGAEEAVVKLAQKATGEILWLSTRSRPELAHPVACMASRALRKPTKTLEIAKRVMNYLSKTVEYGLHYVRDEEEALLTVYSDASYAPGGGRSFGCVMAQVAGMPVCWRASKQPIITLSVAEAELYEAVSSVQLGLGVLAMLNELGDKPVMRLKIDNAAAQGLATESPGSWKTRHLRLRARFLRQEVASQRLIISHVPGDQQKADLGTKSFDVPKFRSLLNLWRLIPFEATDEVIIKTARKLNNKNILLFAMVCFMMVQGARGTSKEDLQLDGSLEFYVIVVLGVVACVALWEVVKYVVDCGKSWWKSWQRKNKKLERLRSKDHEFNDYKTYGCDVYRTGSSYTGHGYTMGYGRYQARVYVSSGVYYQNKNVYYKKYSDTDGDSICGTSLDRCPETAGV